ncbi:MAG: aminotransferase class V-fold PLP-dependent enzyme [Candidatus Kariarchaeaceae archaeon]|jgi:cysteine desulfurase/selenocysteine lyase
MAQTNEYQSLESLVGELRKDFPILSRKLKNDVPLIYFDNAATTQKPKQVIDKLAHYYLYSNANVHRGIHTLSEEASLMFEAAHQTVSDFLNVSYEELVFTRNTTEGLNTVAYGIEEIIGKGDEIVVSRLEHHSNLVPFQQLCRRTGASLKYMEITDDGIIDINSAEKVINDNTKLIAFPHMSNVLGSINPVKEIVDIAEQHDSMTLLDGAQSVPHLAMDMKDLNVDFMAFSGHKMLAPMGIGGLYGREEALQKLNPMQFGGDMISSVSYEDASWNVLPYKFEAGTPNVGGAIALAEAVNYLNKIGMDKVRNIEHYLTSYAMKRLEEMDYVKVYGPDLEHRGGVISFNITGGDNGFFVHPHDVSQVLDEHGVAIRAGHHCAEPLMRLMEVPATSRMSFYIYNTRAEIDIAIDAIAEVNSLFN